MSLTLLTWIDYLVLLVLIVSSVFGVARGLLNSLLGFVGLVVAAYFAAIYAEQLAHYLPANLLGTSGTDGLVATVIAFVLIFIAIVFSVALLTILLTRLIHKMGLSPADRVLGFGFGALRGILLVLIFAFVFELLGFRDYHPWRYSLTRPLAEKILVHLLPLMPKKMGNIFEQ
jgi:membrane protein required for colicin V production